MRRHAALLIAVAALLAPAPAQAAGGWRSEQPRPASGGSAIPLGPIGDLSFYSPNRGVLITEGNDAVEAGVFAYDGTGWSRYATVCGGHDGRVAWAGPTDFWTISDQPKGQEFLFGSGVTAHNRSLCHFVGGQVVASYAQPIGAAGSYERMTAAACLSPSDCWFGGERLPGTLNTGAFHLRWDGSDVTAIPSLTAPEPELDDPGRRVSDLVVHRGRLIESVQVQADDVVPAELPDAPFLLHELLPGTSSPFAPLFTPDPLRYGQPAAQPFDLDGLHLSSDGAQLWAVAGGSSDAPATVTAIRSGGDGPLAQVPLADAGGLFAPADTVQGVAAEPGTDDAWVSFAHFDDQSPPARLAKLHADGTVDSAAVLPTAADGISRKGTAGPIECPAAGQCWMATSTGWLFHLGGALPRDEEPAMHRLITLRPTDASLPSQAPDSLPIDDSGADAPSDQVLPPAPDPGPLPVVTGPPPPKPKPLVSRVTRRLVRGTTLELRFSLRARARVRLVARRGKAVVAQTSRRTLAAGRHRLTLKLDRRRYPTKLDLQATAVAAAPAATTTASGAKP